MSDAQQASSNLDRTDFSPYGLTCNHWWPSSMEKPDYHNEIELNLLTSGSVTYLIGGKKCVAMAGRLSLFWAANPHQIVDFSSDANYMVATIPLMLFLEWRLPPDFVQAVMQGQFLSDFSDDLKVKDAKLMAQWIIDLNQKRLELEKAVLLEMQARLTRFSLNYPIAEKHHKPASVSAATLSKVEQIACFIAKHYTQKITVQTIADHVQLNANYCMILFQKSFGLTLVNFITLHRISHAQRLLATTDKTITEIAFLSGFSSISRFNEAFSKACHYSPREYRKSHKIGAFQ